LTKNSHGTVLNKIKSMVPAARRYRHCAEFSVPWRRYALDRVPSSCDCCRCSKNAVYGGSSPLGVVVARDGDEDCNADDNASRYSSTVATAQHPRHSRHHVVVQVQGVLPVCTGTIRLYRQVTRRRW